MRDFISDMNGAPIALETEAANVQHYEAPADFFKLVLGKRMKYSSCYWPDGVAFLDDAEEAMLDLTCRRAELTNGMNVLDLGCGWGSLTLWITEKYPDSRILAVSNSRYQADTIREGIAEKGLRNVEVQTSDVNTFRPDKTFDRIISVEMFEHMRNWSALLENITDLLSSDGKLYVHIFSHKRIPFLFRSSSTVRKI
jgi:cyclopropane-fatty-acyl-phospholipid synthase